MAKQAKKKRRSMAKSNRRAVQAAKTGVSYLKLPNNVKLFREKENKTYLLDVIPYITDKKRHPEADYIEDDIWWRLPYKLHFNVGPERKKVVCPTTFGQKCKLCDDRQKIYQDPEGDEEIAKLLRPKNRTLYIVIPRKDKEYPEEPHIFDISNFNFGEQLDKELDYEEDYLTFPDLDEGYTLKVRFSKEMMGKNSFAKADRIDFKERDPLDDSLPDEMPVLEDCLVILSAEEIDKIYEGLDDIYSYDDKDDDKDDDSDNDSDDEDTEDTEETNDDSDDDSDDEDTENEITANDIDDMKKKELMQVAKDNDINVKGIKKVSDLKQAIKEDLDLIEMIDEDTNGCPHGYEFGEDNGEYDECIDCNKYDDCLDALE